LSKNKEMKNPKKILIVDDEEIVVNVLTPKLEAEGFLVDAVEDGEQALQKIQEDKPDLILLDIIMPKLDGISVLKELKQNEETKNIPIIILTNLYDDQKMTEVLQAGNTDYLVKVEHPVSEVIKKVKEKLE